MGKKRKSRSGRGDSKKAQKDEYPLNETFDDSEDEFYAHQDKILIDEGPTARRRRKIEEQLAELQPSDEEVFEDSDDGQTGEEEKEVDEDATGASDATEAQDHSEEEEDERFWGTSRKDYYNADPIETEADALEEEAEARRLQQKQLQGMTEADFGYDEFEWAASEKAAESGRPIVEKLPPVQIPKNATKDEILAILGTRYPEFEPLAEDLVNLDPQLQVLKHEVEKVQRKGAKDTEMASSASLTKFRALSAYLAAIAVYMAVLTSTKDGLAMPPAEIRDHPIMATLLRCRQLWDATKDLDDAEEWIDEEALPVIAVERTEPLNSGTQKQRKGKVVNGTASNGFEQTDSSKPKKRKQVTVDGDYQDLSIARAKKSKKQKRPDLQEILSQAAKATPDQEASDFGDEAPLTHEEAAEKAKKKKSLRFYTSQITQKANKRGAASRDAGGDDDVPYKERIRDKQERLTREAEHRAQANKPSMNEVASDDEGETATRDEINDASNDYYNTIVSKSQQKKADKKARAEAYAQAAREGAQVYEEAQIGPDGKRKITYAIEKNKGLTPKRKKEVRNPRVKKKKRYEQKMKKLSSMRPVYKGGEGKGGYGGELTGIKTNVVKSVKL